MSGKRGEYDEAMTYLIWSCCASRNGKLGFTMPHLVVFLFNDLLLPFDASRPRPLSFVTYLSDVLLLLFGANYNARGLKMEVWEEC